MLELDAAGEAVQPLAEVALLVVGPREAAVKAKAERAESLRVHVERREHATAAPRFAAHVRRPGNVADVRREGDPVARCDHEVRPAAAVPEVVARFRSALELRSARHVVPDEARSATHARLVIGQVSGPEAVTHLRFEVPEL